MNSEAAGINDMRREETGPFRKALGCFATGVGVVTASLSGKMSGVTINSFASLSLDPPLILWSLSLRSPSLPLFRETPYFAINILAEHQSSLSTQFATPYPDKFAGVDWRGGLGGAPLLADCAASFECIATSQIEGGDHMLFIGQVERFRQTEQDALMFYRGQYMRRSETVAA
jgi:4-hydroxyphenylacetate 3-hydroxylase, reductase component